MSETHREAFLVLFFFFLQSGIKTSVNRKS